MTQNTFAALILSASIVVAATIFTYSSGLITAGPQVRVYDVVMENNRYNPSYISAYVGDTVIINFENKDSVAHAVDLPEFGASVPKGHVFPGEKAQMKFLANKKSSTDAATCGGPDPTDKTDDHGEELIVDII